MFGLFSLKTSFAQKKDSTKNIYTNLLVQMKVSKTDYDDAGLARFRSEDSVQFSSFHIKDKNLRHSLFSLTVKEYKNGLKVHEEDIFTKVPFEQYRLFNTIEDSSCVFSVFRKEIDLNTIAFAYGLPVSNLETRTCKVNNINDYIIVEGLSYFGAVPLDKPFTLFVYTSPDVTNNFPFYKGDNRRQTDPGKWSEVYKLRHSFIIDLTIHQPEQKVKESSPGHSL